MLNYRRGMGKDLDIVERKFDDSKPYNKQERNEVALTFNWFIEYSSLVSGKSDIDYSLAYDKLIKLLILA